MFNQKLKFSWGHIFAFVALLFIAYMTFLSVTYYTLGNYILAGVITFAVDVSLLILFISLQRLKACDNKFQKNIRRERILFVVSFILFLILMIPFLKGWSVIKDNDKIIQNFKSSINESKNIFTQYEQYSKKRIDNYKQRLDSIATSVKTNKQKRNNNINKLVSKASSKYRKINNMHKRDSTYSRRDERQKIPDLYKEIGFDEKKDSYLIDNRVTLLKLQIDSTNYEKIRDNALQWIEQANQGGSVWNVFLFGNLKTIKSSISSWHEDLQEFSSKKFIAEDESINRFDEENTILKSAINSIDQLEDIYKHSNDLYIWGLFTMIVSYLFLLMPWIVQERNTKTRITFLSNKQNHDIKSDFFKDSDNKEYKTDNNEEEYVHKPF